MNDTLLGTNDSLNHPVDSEHAGRERNTAALSRSMQRRLRWRLRRRAMRTMPDTDLDLDCGLTVHAIVERYPTTRDVFNRFGLDTCCGGAVSVEEAARREGVDARTVCEALREVVETV
ncbi:MAG TPA: DUF542 domain-containing protein [Gemmatimonadaceae bacterium]|nr:DUF542 domain-containing protein [Gemmatimonadaceae bacterium]